MLKKLLFTIAIACTTSAIFAQSGTLQGKIVNQETKEPIPFANIIIESGGKQLGGTTSDFDGKYTIKPIPPGKYDVKATFVGFKNIMIQGVTINSDKIRFLDIEMEATVTTLPTFEVFDYKVPLIDKDETSSGGTMTSEEISKMAGRSAASVAITVGGVFSQDGEMGSIRGQRTEGTAMFIDGVRVRGSQSVPQASIEQVSVITSGTPARYGDVTGGVVNVTTKGPSREFGAGMELLTSQLLDNFGYNLLGFNIQGPLIKGKDESKSSALLGFFIAGEANFSKDSRPFSTGVNQVKSNALKSLEGNPLRPSGTGFGTIPNSSYTRFTDIENISAKSNDENFGVDLSAKIDVRTTKNTNLTFGGTYSYDKGRVWSYSNSMFNAKNNGEESSNTSRVYGRFTQRFPADKETKTLVKNVYYSIQADYTRYYYKSQNKYHGDDLFKYGYVGKFNTYKIKSYERGSDTTLGYSDILIHNNFFDTLFAFTNSNINPDLGSYTQQFYDLYPLNSGLYSNSTSVQNAGGLLNGQTPTRVYGLWNNTGTPYGTYQIVNNAQFNISANGSADIGNHEFQFGFQYEQRNDKGIAYATSSNNATGLWTLMRALANKHIEQLDKSNPHLVFDANNIFQDTIWYDRLYDASSQSFFDINVRKKLGLKVDGLDWIDVDSFDPDFYTIDMFNADELLNNGKSYVSYYGYDHTGKLLNNKPSFDDFFTKQDEFGNFTREIGAFEPIYMAGYIQDKFAFKDLVFNIGLRIDRFDANQKVLKDPYLLFEAKTVKEVNNLGAHPSNMGSDYVVYVNDVNNPVSIVGYRDGYKWFNAEGIEITDPSILEGSSGIAPYLVDPGQTVLSSKAFKDYEPQLNFMPRISFSFPISDEALFFAHYDVLTKRPTTGTRLDPTQYYFIQSLGSTTLNNPSLKPEKTIDYELGFQQKLSNSSSLKFSAYYREMRDLVQAFRYTAAYPVSYTSLNNIDFGTVKGTTIAYDLRRTNNVWMKASYTLQFAEGTGSNATSGINLVNSGQPNLRTLNPLDFDRRHSISLVVDYRYAAGKKYNGPVITRKIKGTDKVKSVKLLENTGANFTFTGGSGVPYTQESNATSDILGTGAGLIQGSLNGARLPWSFRIDARIDKDIQLQFGGKGEGKEKKLAYLNVYVQVLNILNSQNVLSVYRFTGNPDDDGYLSAAEFQNQINSQYDSQAFRELYSLAVNNPYNYSLPRRIRLGVVLNF